MAVMLQVIACRQDVPSCYSLRIWFHCTEQTTLWTSFVSMRKKCLLYFHVCTHITWLSMSLFLIRPIMHFSNDASFFSENIYRISLKIFKTGKKCFWNWEWKKREGERGLECHLWNNWDDFFSKFIVHYIQKFQEINKCSLLCSPALIKNEFKFLFANISYRSPRVDNDSWWW